MRSEDEATAFCGVSNVDDVVVAANKLVTAALIFAPPTAAVSLPQPANTLTIDTVNAMARISTALREVRRLAVIKIYSQKNVCCEARRSQCANNQVVPRRSPQREISTQRREISTQKCVPYFCHRSSRHQSLCGFCDACSKAVRKMQMFKKYSCVCSSKGRIETNSIYLISGS